MKRLAIATLFAVTPCVACDVDYELTAKWDATPRRFEVKLDYDAGPRTESRLRGTPEWGGVTDFGQALRNMRTAQPETKIAPLEPHLWKVEHASGKRIEIRYDVVNAVAQVDAQAPLDHRDTFRTLLGADFFQAFGHGLFLIPDHASGAGSTLCITFAGLPKAWSFASSFGVGHHEGRVEYAWKDGSDAVRHAVFLGGDFRILRRDIEKRPLHVAVRGAWSFTDAKLADATAAIVAAHRAFWNDFDFPYFLVSLIPNRLARGSIGGTAVHDAFAMHASNDFSVPGPAFESLIGHEHLHTWIPGRIGRLADGPEEPRQYWLSEGFTNYLTHRLLLRAGTWTLEDYAAGLNRAIQRYLASPALAATNARIAKEFWSDRDVQGIPYVRGELVALRWDAQLRASGASLDEVLRSLIQPRSQSLDKTSKRPDDLATARLLAALAAPLGPHLDEDVAAFVEAGDLIPIGPDFLGPCFAATTESRPRFELGIDSASMTARRVQGLVAGSNAEKAGIRDGMELAGWSIPYGDVTRDVTLQVKEGAAVRDVTFRPVAAKPVDVPVFSVRPGARSDPACRAWMPGPA